MSGVSGVGHGKEGFGKGVRSLCREGGTYLISVYLHGCVKRGGRRGGGGWRVRAGCWVCEDVAAKVWVRLGDGVCIVR